MQLSAFTIVDEYPGPEGPADRIREVVGLAEAAETGGLTSLWVAEHHFHSGGVCPSPAVLLAACGARTTRLRLGSLVSVLPFHRPIDLAEQYALLDRLTGGRLNLGVGSGYLPFELDGFGVPPESKRELFESHLATILAALEGRPVSAVPGGPLVQLNVRAVQRPHPPVWVAAQRRETLPFIARRGFSLALIPYATVADLDELAAEIREYRAALPTGVPGHVTIGLHLYAGNDPGSASSALQRYLDSRLAFQSTHYREKVARDPRHAHASAIEESGFALFGTPAEVARRLRAFSEAGVDEVAGIFDFGALDRQAVGTSVEQLGAAFRREFKE